MILMLGDTKPLICHKDSAWLHFYTFPKRFLLHFIPGFFRFSARIRENSNSCPPPFCFVFFPGKMNWFNPLSIFLYFYKKARGHFSRQFAVCLFFNGPANLSPNFPGGFQDNFENLEKNIFGLVARAKQQRKGFFSAQNFHFSPLEGKAERGRL